MAGQQRDSRAVTDELDLIFAGFSRVLDACAATDIMHIEFVEQLNALIQRVWEEARLVVGRLAVSNRTERLRQAVFGVIADRGEASTLQTADVCIRRLADLRRALTAVSELMSTDDGGPTDRIADIRWSISLLTLVYLHSPDEQPVQPIFTIVLNGLIRRSHALSRGDGRRPPECFSGIEVNRDFRTRLSSLTRWTEQSQDAHEEQRHLEHLLELRFRIFNGYEAHSTKRANDVSSSSGTALAPVCIALGTAIAHYADHIAEHLPVIGLNLQTALAHPMPEVCVEVDGAIQMCSLELRIDGHCVETIEVFPKRRLAIHFAADNGMALGELTKEPTFGLNATWVEAEQEMTARLHGYALIDGLSVALTFVTERVHGLAHLGFGPDALEDCLAEVARQPTNRLSSVQALLTRARLLEIFRALVAQGISLKRPSSIVNALLMFHGNEVETASLVERIRPALARRILMPLRCDDEPLSVVRLTEASKEFYEAHPADFVDTTFFTTHCEELRKLHASSVQRRRPTLLVVPTELRRRISECLGQRFRRLHVLSEAECRHVEHQITLARV